MKTSVFVNKYLYTTVWIWTILFLLPSTAQSQNALMCQQKYEQAKVDFENGKVFKVLELKDCINKLPLYLRDNANYLLFQSYVLTNQDSLATIAMQQLLRENPDIDPKNEDVKFRYYFQKFKSKPREIGFMIGQSFSKPILTSAKSSSGLTLGFSHHFYILPKLSVFKNLLYSERANRIIKPTGKHNVPGELMGHTYLDLFLTESEIKASGLKGSGRNYPVDDFYLNANTGPTFIEGASGLNWIVLSSKKIEFFLKGGLAVNYLFESEIDNAKINMVFYDYEIKDGKYTRKPWDDPVEFLGHAQEVTHHTKVNLHYLGGAGIRVKVNKGVFFLESRYQQSLLKQKISVVTDIDGLNTGLENSDSARTLSFHTRSLTVSVGYLFHIQRFKRLKGGFGE